jgi:hypothetical protein
VAGATISHFPSGPRDAGLASRDIVPHGVGCQLGCTSAIRSVRASVRKNLSRGDLQHLEPADARPTSHSPCDDHETYGMKLTPPDADTIAAPMS